MNIAQTIKEGRESKGWSQSELSRQSGITQATISRIEAGQQIPSANTTHALCEALHLPVRTVIRAAAYADYMRGEE